MMQRTRSLTIPCLALLLLLLATPLVALPSGGSAGTGNHDVPSLDSWFAKLVSWLGPGFAIEPHESVAAAWDGPSSSDASGEMDSSSTEPAPDVTPQAGPQIDPDG